MDKGCRGRRRVGGEGVSRRRIITERPRRVKRLEARLNIFVANDVAGDDKLASRKDVDDTARRLFRRAEVKTHDTAIREMTVPTGPGESHTDERAKYFEVGDGGGAFAEDVDREHVAVGGSR